MCFPHHLMVSIHEKYVHTSKFCLPSQEYKQEKLYNLSEHHHADMILGAICQNNTSRDVDFLLLRCSGMDKYIVWHVVASCQFMATKDDSPGRCQAQFLLLFDEIAVSSDWPWELPCGRSDVSLLFSPLHLFSCVPPMMTSKQDDPTTLYYNYNMQ